MNYLKSTFRYLKDHFLRMFAYCIVPALVLGLISSPVSLVRMLSQNQYDNNVSFSEIFLGATDLNKPYKIVIMILAFIIYAVFAAVCVGSVQHKMRYGHFYKINVHNFFKNVNGYFLPMAKGMLVLMVLMELLGLFTSIFVFFWSKVISVKWVAIGLCVATTIGFLAAFFFVASLLTLVVPNMTIRGFGLFKSIKLSSVTVLNNFAKIIPALVLPIVVAYVPLVIVNIFNVNVLSQILDILFYLFAFMYYHVLLYVVYFDLEDVKTEQIGENNYWG